MQQRYDRSSKWLLQHHGDALLRLGGVRNVRRWRALQAEVVQPQKLPDGLLEVYLPGRREPSHFLIEIATYPERRADDQMMDDVMLVYQDRRVLPEALTLVLRPRGRVRITGDRALQSHLAWTRFQVQWRVVELWTLPAEELLAANEVGLIPWVPLTQFDGPPQPLFEECRHRIDEQARREEHANLLAVTQVLSQLRFNDPVLLDLLGGERAMIESPLIEKIVAKAKREASREAKRQTAQELLLEFLTGRFAEVPQEMAEQLRAIQSERKLRQLAAQAGKCPNLAAFRAAMSS